MWYCNYKIVYLSACPLGCELFVDSGHVLFTFIPGSLDSANYDTGGAQ